MPPRTFQTTRARTNTRRPWLQMVVLVLCLPISAHAQILATKAGISASYVDLRAYHRDKTNDDFLDVLKSPQDVEKSLEDVLIAKVFSQRHKGSPPTDDYELTIRRQIADRSTLDTELAMADQRARKLIETSKDAVKARALEIYLSGDPPRSQFSADFQHIVFDLSKRTFAETGERVQAAMKALEQGDAFEAVVVRFSDEATALENQGILRGVPAAGMDPTLARTLFDQLKPGQWSQPITSRRGLHIVKLLAKHQPVRRPFADVQREFIGHAESEYIAREREKVLRPLRETPTVFDRAEMKKILLVPDPEVVRNAAKILAEQERKANEAKLAPANPAK